jgi:uncharacterized protein YtpQ (UPF0354 family)
MFVKPIELKRELEKRLIREDRVISYDRDEEKLRIEDKETKKGITLSLSGLASKGEQNKDTVIEETVYHVEEVLSAMSKDIPLSEKQRNLFPVIRSTSFPTSQDDKPLLYEDHTAETRIYYALDLGNSYRLIKEEMLENEGWIKEQVKEAARFNLKSLDIKMKEDAVAGNTFYFVNHNDGYDASRILNIQFLEQMADKVSGKLAVAVPHQDVLILADIENDQGYDILAQMTMHFFTNGRVPITALPFLYENGTLEPIFILAKNKPTDNN